jgi:hypothetical protein
VALRTVEKASSYGQLFQYTPEFYVESVIRATYALHRYFHPIVNIEELKGKFLYDLLVNGQEYSETSQNRSALGPKNMSDLAGWPVL